MVKESCAGPVMVSRTLCVVDVPECLRLTEKKAYLAQRSQSGNRGKETRFPNIARSGDISKVTAVLAVISVHSPAFTKQALDTGA